MDSSTLNLIIGGVIGIGGALLGTIATGFFNRSNLRLQLFAAQTFEERKLKLQHLEELHDIIGAYNHSIVNFSMQLRILPRDDSLPTKEKFSVIMNELMMPLGRIHTKVRIHAPELNNNYGAINNLATNLLNTGTDYYHGSKSFTELLSHQNLLNLECKKFFHAVEQVISNSELSKLQIKL